MRRRTFLVTLATAASAAFAGVPKSEELYSEETNNVPLERDLAPVSWPMDAVMGAVLLEMDVKGTYPHPAPAPGPLVNVYLMPFEEIDVRNGWFLGVTFAEGAVEGAVMRHKAFFTLQMPVPPKFRIQLDADLCEVQSFKCQIMVTPLIPVEPASVSEDVERFADEVIGDTFTTDWRMLQ